MHTPSWMIRKPEFSAEAFRLYCFPYAGGNGTAFLSWQATINPKIQICGIQMPGRGARLLDSPATSLQHLVKSLAQSLAQEPKHSFAFYGHSFGALLAFELARYLHANDRPMPQLLIVSGCDSPPNRTNGLPLHELEGKDFLEALAQYGGTPPEVLEHPELMELATPAIRLDFSLAANYQYCLGKPLPVPITALCGKMDPFVQSETIGLWQSETLLPLTTHWFEGDHFFINSHKNSVVRCIDNALIDVLSKVKMDTESN